MRVLVLLLILFAIHTTSLWHPGESLAGGSGDTLAHATLPGLYCSKILKWDLQTDQYLLGTINISTNFDSPFPMILTCPFSSLGSQTQFHIFAALQILLVILASWLLGRAMNLTEPWLFAFTLFAWWSGFYAARINHHFTLLSGIWGFELILWSYLTLNWQKIKNLLVRAVLLGLVFSGTFHNAAMLSLPTVLLLTLSISQNSQKLDFKSWLKNIFLAATVSLAIFVLFFGPAIVGYLQSGQPHSLMERAHFSVDLINPLFPLWMKVLNDPGLRPQMVPIERANPLDMLILAIVFISFFNKEFWQKLFRRILFALAVFCYIWALGPEVHILGKSYGPNFVFNFLEAVPPFSISRAPGRFIVVASLALTYLAFDFMKETWMKKKWNLAIAAGLILWIFVTGPVLNEEIFVPVWEFKNSLPQKALEAIKASPAETIVVHLPTAVASDPLQNFMQLFHQHRISAGYLAYTSYTTNSMQNLLQDPFLSKSDCANNSIGFHRTPFLDNFSLLHDHLKEKHFNYIILNKNLLNDPDCNEMVNWLRDLGRQEWVHPVDETPAILVWEIR